MKDTARIIGSAALCIPLAVICWHLCTATSHTQNPHPRIIAADYAKGSKTGGINEATRVLPITGGIIETPCGEVDIAETLVIGTGTPTTKSTIDAISLVGCGAGRGDDVAAPPAGATTLKWTGAPGGTVLRVAGPIGNVGIYDLQIDADYKAIGLDIAHSYQSHFTRVSIIHTRVAGLRTQAVDYKFPLMATGNNNNTFDTVIVSAIASGAAAQIGQAAPNAQSIFDSASNTFINCSFVGGANGSGLELRLADNNSFYQTVMFSSTAALKLVGVAGLPASNYFYPGIVIGPIVTEPFGFVAASPNFMLPLADTDTPHDTSNFGNFLLGFNAQGKFFGKWDTIPTRVQ